MPNWKKVITSGSDAALNSLLVTNSLTASGLIYPSTDGTTGQVIITDGAGNLSFSPVENTAIVIKNVSGVTIQKGTPCYITGSGTSGNLAGVFPADAANPLRMPAGVIAGETLTAGAEGIGLINGFIADVATSIFNAGDSIYVAAGGGYTNVRPTGSSILVQKLGNVEKSHPTNGSGVINGPGYYNDLPNIQAGYTWVGNSNGVAVAIATSSIQNVISASYALTASYWNGTVTSASYALTASYVQNAVTASYVLNAVSSSYTLSSSYATQALSASFATSTAAVAGTTNYISKFATSTTLGNSLIYDNGTNTGIGTTSPSAKLHIVSPGALVSDIGFKVRNSADTGDLLLVTGNGYVQTGVNGLAIPRTDTPNGTNNAVISHQTSGVVRIDKPIEISGVYGRSGYSNTQVALDLGYAYASMKCYGGATNTGFTFNTIAATTGTYFARFQNGATDLLTILTGGNTGISNSAPSYKLDVSGSARISGAGNTSISSSLVVYGSGSTQPVFTVQGSQGELFSVTDNLSGSLFSVNDISGLPILEVFSDNTTLMGSYQAPSLNTTVKTTTIAGNNVIYSIPTSSYNGAWFEYVATSASNARAGQIMSVCSSNNITYTETTTTDIGSTTGLAFRVMITGSNFALTGSSTTAGWTIKTIVRSI